MPTNYRMIEKVKTGEAIPVDRYTKVGDYYMLPKFVEGKDYCHAGLGLWIWSIGERLSDGKIFASLKTDLYQNPNYKCLWLR